MENTMPSSPIKIKSSLFFKKDFKNLEKPSVTNCNTSDESSSHLESFTNNKSQKKRKKKKTLLPDNFLSDENSDDETFQSFCKVPSEKRKSLRLQNKETGLSYEDLPEETSVELLKRRKLQEINCDHSILLKNRKYYDTDEDLNHLEEVVYKPKVRRTPAQKKIKRTFFSVEDVTESMLQNISKKVSEKVYCSFTGTSCHQCRQKTTDTKTSCRSQHCEGVRGQFCGVCLLNRYGEKAEEALKNPNWHCPVCRGICNCSFCRARQGKRPTGILVPWALKTGHKSVKELLDSLGGKGDYADVIEDPEGLLGFSRDMEFAHLANGSEVYTSFSLYIFIQMKEILDSHINKLMNEVTIDIKDDDSDPTQDTEGLLGFSRDLKYAHLANGSIEDTGFSFYLFVQMTEIINPYISQLHKKVNTSDFKYDYTKKFEDDELLSENKNE